MLALFGIILLILGFLALGSTVVTTFLSTLFLGWILLLAGIAAILYGIFSYRTEDHAMLVIINGVLGIIFGAIILYNPALSVASLTLFLAFYFFVSGGVAVVSSLMDRGENWGWTLTVGVLSFLLGVFALNQWPATGLFLIGLLVGVELLLLGIGLLALQFAPKEDTRPSYSSGGLAGTKGGKTRNDDSEEVL